MEKPLNSGAAPEDQQRRSFLKKAITVLVGFLVSVVPAGVSLLSFLDPLRRKEKGGEFVKITSLEALAEDGMPRKFPVIATRHDAWTRYPNAPVGAVYLRRVDSGEIEALNVVCPHAGCFVDFQPDTPAYLCPCHNSLFGLDGAITDPTSPSPRGLDTMDVEIRNENEVWVKFQNFIAGHVEKKPVT